MGTKKGREFVTIFTRPVIAIMIVLGAISPSAFAQEKIPSQQAPPKSIGMIKGEGFASGTWETIKLKLESREGAPFSRTTADGDLKKLMAMGQFASADYAVADMPDGSIGLTFRVTRYDTVAEIKFQGVKQLAQHEIDTAGPRVAVGSYLNPYLLKLDAAMITDLYRSKGYHFVQVSPKTTPSETGSGILLTWEIREGPYVSVNSITFHGNALLKEAELREVMMTKENGFLSSSPYVEKTLQNDLELLKHHYMMNGCLDVYKESRKKVFIERLEFSPGLDSVDIVIRVVEGKRFKIKSVAVQGNVLFPTAEVLSWLKAKPGDFYMEKNARRDVATIEEKYGERAYIMAEIEARPIFPLDGDEIDLVYHIVENKKVRVGDVTIRGNTKTRDDVIRREVRVYPGEDYNEKELKRGINRLRDRRWFEYGGIHISRADGDAPDVQNIDIEVEETATGTAKLAGGYSSSYGVIGMFEINQRNFDIADLPKSFEDVINGTGFAGGGQLLRLRFLPSARQTSYSLYFREPYIFGHDLGFSVNLMNMSSIRESYDEQRRGGSVGLDKRWDDLRVGLDFKYYTIEIDDVDFDAPRSVIELEGRNNMASLTPSIRYDTLDSLLFPTSGYFAELTYEYAGSVLPGDFDFEKTTLKTAYYHTLYTTEEKSKHVGSLQFTGGLAHELADADTVPIIERFFAGGRDTIRGFEFRGIGPRENDDPVGGKALVAASAEYTFPLYTDMLRGAIFYDWANLTSKPSDMELNDFRMSYGFGIRLVIPNLNNIPLSLDFGFPISKEDDDDRQTILFDIGYFF